MGIKSTLDSEGLRPQKKFGQHFLTDPRILESIAAAADLSPEDTVLEIGPGLGHLTRVLARRAGRLCAIEVDRALIHHREEILERQYVQQRIAAAAVELFASACVLSRWDAELQSAPGTDGAMHNAAGLFLHRSFRRVRRWLAKLHQNDDAAVSAVADHELRRS